MVQFCLFALLLWILSLAAGGFLTDRWLGKDDPGFENLENRSLTKYRLIIDEYGTWADFQRLLQLLSGIAGQRSTSVASVAVGWVLRQVGTSPPFGIPKNFGGSLRAAIIGIMIGRNI